MKHILKTRMFCRWVRKTELTDTLLRAAIEEMEQGLVDADLGGNVFKKRIALPGRGKRGGTRTIIATNKQDRWFFIYGFEKNDRENITQAELVAFQRTAADLLESSQASLDSAIACGELEEVRHE